MGGDDARSAARQLEQVAEEARRLADRSLVAAATPWQSTAAAGFRRRLTAEVVRIRGAADHVDDAAAAARRLAEELDAVLAQALRVVRGVWP